MRFQTRQIICILLIFISTTASCAVFGQVGYSFITPEIDSICRNTLDYIRIKQSLTSQQYAITQDAEHLQNTIDFLTQRMEQTLKEQKIVKSELMSINRYLDSLIPKRPDSPSLKENFYNYFERRNDNRLRLDVNWENTVHFLITKYITTILFVHLKYEHNTTFPMYEEIEGVQTMVDNVPKLQFKESLGIAFLHRF